jgi:hypothetical protein
MTISTKLSVFALMLSSYLAVTCPFKCARRRFHASLFQRPVYLNVVEDDRRESQRQNHILASPLSARKKMGGVLTFLTPVDGGVSLVSPSVFGMSTEEH